MNKTPLTNRTHRIIANLPPDIYLEKLETEDGLPSDWLDDIVSTHLIDAAHLRGVGSGRDGQLQMTRKPPALSAADFDAFYQSRSAKLLELIQATGMRLVSPEAAPESAADYQQEQSA